MKIKELIKGTDAQAYISEYIQKIKDQKKAKKSA